MLCEQVTCHSLCEPVHYVPAFSTGGQHGTFHPGDSTIPSSHYHCHLSPPLSSFLSPLNSSHLPPHDESSPTLLTPPTYHLITYPSQFLPSPPTITVPAMLHTITVVFTQHCHLHKATSTTVVFLSYHTHIAPTISAHCRPSPYLRWQGMLITRCARMCAGLW